MKKILIVDDSMFMRKMLNDILTRYGDKKYQIIEAGSRAQAEDMIKKEKPDLILLDIIMPEGEEAGIKVLKKVMSADSKAKVVMISAVGQDTIVEECKKLGAKDYITKPFDDKLVIKTVEKYLA